MPYWSFWRIISLISSKALSRFGMYLKVLEFSFNKFSLNKDKILIIDEIGKLELKGEGYHVAFQKLLSSFDNNLNKNKKILLIVRDYLMDEVKNKYQIEPLIFHPGPWRG